MLVLMQPMLYVLAFNQSKVCRCMSPSKTWQKSGAEGSSAGTNLTAI